jgi:hypothetical protein
VARLDRAVAGLVYASVVLGVLFLYVLSGTPGVPGFLFPSILVGELVWVACAVAVYRGARWAPYMAVVLAVVTLGVSLPQPEHYGFAQSGQVAAFLIFAGGSALQFALIAAVALRAYWARRP